MSATGQKGLYVNLNSGAVQASLLPFRNALMNGDMLVNRRGTSTNLASLTAVATATPGSFVTDRWNVYRAGFAAGASIGQGTDLTYADIPFSDVGIDSYGRVGRTVGNALTAAIYCDYNMESQDSYRFAGRQVTLSFYYRNGVNFSDTALTATLYYATGIDQSLVTAFGSFTSFATQTFAKVGAWTRATLTGLVPTTATQIALRFSYTPVGTAGATDHFDLTGVQLETGSVATPFETRLGWTDIPTFSSQTNSLQISGNLDITGHNFAQVSSAPHVTFSTETSNVFLSWLQRTTTTLAGSWWQTPATPRFSTIGGMPGGGAYVGGVLLPDGRVVFVPSNATTIGIFNPATNAYSTVPNATMPGTNAYGGGVLLPDGRVVFVPFNATTIGIFNPATNAYSTIAGPPGNFAYYGGFLLPDGRVLFIPSTATTIGLFNPATNAYSTIPRGSGNFFYGGGVLLPDGRVVFVPGNSTAIGIFNSATNTYTTIASGSGDSAYNGGVLLPDGRVLFIPGSSTTIGIFNPVTNAYSTIAGPPDNQAYEGGVLLPDGRVAFMPRNATTIGIFNPATNTYSTIAGAPPGIAAYASGVLLPDGRVVFVPYGATTIGILSGFPRPPPELCYHPCFNKY